jgi:hypothetical protein
MKTLRLNIPVETSQQIILREKWAESITSLIENLFCDYKGLLKTYSEARENYVIQDCQDISVAISRKAIFGRRAVTYQNCIFMLEGENNEIPVIRFTIPLNQGGMDFVRYDIRQEDMHIVLGQPNPRLIAGLLANLVLYTDVEEVVLNDTLVSAKGAAAFAFFAIADPRFGTKQALSGLLWDMVESREI